MKAKYFKKLRQQLVYYEVKHSAGLFGDFNFYRYDGEIVLAKNPINAIERAKKRGYGRGYSIDYDGRTEEWAHWKVKLKGKSDHFRNIKFF